MKMKKSNHKMVRKQYKGPFKANVMKAFCDWFCKTGVISSYEIVGDGESVTFDGAPGRSMRDFCAGIRLIIDSYECDHNRRKRKNV